MFFNNKLKLEFSVKDLITKLELFFNHVLNAQSFSSKISNLKISLAYELLL